jgi:hypothetical protein
MEKHRKAPDAVAKLAAKGGDVSKLTKPEIVAILFVCYNKDEKDNSHKKEYLVNLAARMHPDASRQSGTNDSE